MVKDVGRSWGVCTASERREEEAPLPGAALPQQQAHGPHTGQTMASLCWYIAWGLTEQEEARGSGRSILNVTK